MSNENIEIDDGSLVEPPQQYEDSIGFSNPEIAALFNASTPSTEEQEVPLTMVQEEADSNIATQPPVLSVEELTTLSEDEAKVSEESEAVLDKHEQDLKESYEAACELSKQYKWTEIQCVKYNQIRTIEDINDEILQNVLKHIN